MDEYGVHTVIASKVKYSMICYSTNHSHTHTCSTHSQNEIDTLMMAFTGDRKTQLNEI